MSSLNPQQKRAVEATDGRVLVLAGAGSGKTKVIVHRIAHLVRNKGVEPESILGLTFTNKAAAEMRERLGAMIPKTQAKKVILSTFHSFCMRLLRKEIHHLGFTKNFSLYDERDMQRLLKQIAAEVGEIESVTPYAELISSAKSQGLHPKEIDAKTSGWEDAKARTLYSRLHESLRTFNALDFDSLLSLTVELFRDHPEVLANYQDHFSHIMIDEYQDTNPVQYEIARLLSAKNNNLCVVGDDDQSIYGWRGAEIKNILSFPADTTVRLEQNYRSLPTILKAANCVIANNAERHAKELYSATPGFELITLFHAPTEADEASAVVQRILHLKQQGNYKWREFAILYRSNLIARNFELALLQAMWKKGDQSVRGIPYQVFGGTEFYERSEVKDLMAYLRFLTNPKDEDALLRIINVPRRGISDKTMSILTKENRKQKVPLWNLLEQFSGHPELKDRAVKAIQAFVALIREAKKPFETKPLSVALSDLVELIDYKRAIEEEVKSEKMQLFKWENVQGCIEAMKLYEQEAEDPSLEDFLSTTLLDARKFEKGDLRDRDDRVNLMTFHSAKGLEFTAVFLVALEDPIIPHERSQRENKIEEERRLMYVAITRAKQHLNLSMAKQRKRFGKEEKMSPSRFLFEIPKELLRVLSHRTPW